MPQKDFGQGAQGQWQPGQFMNAARENPPPWLQQMQANRPQMAQAMMNWQPGQGGFGMGNGAPTPATPGGTPQMPGQPSPMAQPGIGGGSPQGWQFGKWPMRQQGGF